MPLCICYNCNRKMDCDASGKCDICEADAEGFIPEVVMGDGRLKVESLTMDREIHVILKQLHRQLAGPERQCRWEHNDHKQVYWCEHVIIPARDVTAAYWAKREGVN